MTLPPIYYHTFRVPLPYAKTLALQEKLHALQLLQRKTSLHKDILLLLEHRPVYTAGRRQTGPSVAVERTRLNKMGADFHTTARGGVLTYHGPGQIVGYPLLDLSRWSPAMAIREYICRLQSFLGNHLQESHGLSHIPSEHTGVFLDPVTKIASIGVQVRHRLTSHGFAINITKEPLQWFNQVVACGLHDVKAGCIEVACEHAVRLESEMLGLVNIFGRTFERDMVQLSLSGEGEVGDAIAVLEAEARLAGEWPKIPILQQ